MLLKRIHDLTYLEITISGCMWSEKIWKILIIWKNQGQMTKIAQAKEKSEKVIFSQPEVLKS